MLRLIADQVSGNSSQASVRCCERQEHAWQLSFSFSILAYPHVQYSTYRSLACTSQLLLPCSLILKAIPSRRLQ